MPWFSFILLQFLIHRYENWSLKLEKSQNSIRNSGHGRTGLRKHRKRLSKNFDMFLISTILIKDGYQRSKSDGIGISRIFYRSSFLFMPIVRTVRKIFFKFVEGLIEEKVIGNFERIWRIKKPVKKCF